MMRQYRQRDFKGEYHSWYAAKRRCYDPKDNSFADYGARGITMCDEWINSFSAFMEHIGPKPSAEHTLERADNSRGYEPGNVRWATRLEQRHNRRDT